MVTPPPTASRFGSALAVEVLVKVVGSVRNSDVVLPLDLTIFCPVRSGWACILGFALALSLPPLSVCVFCFAKPHYFVFSPSPAYYFDLSPVSSDCLALSRSYEKLHIFEQSETYLNEPT